MPFIHKFGINADAKDHVHIFADDITEKICAQTEGLPYKAFTFTVFSLPGKYTYTPAFTANGVRSAEKAGINIRRIKQYEWRCQYQVACRAVLDGINSILAKEDKELEIYRSIK